jgi:hypothetical protein
MINITKCIICNYPLDTDLATAKCRNAKHAFTIFFKSNKIVIDLYDQGLFSTYYYNDDRFTCAIRDEYGAKFNFDLENFKIDLFNFNKEELMTKLRSLIFYS